MLELPPGPGDHGMHPVPGWTAKKQVRAHGMTSYTVIRCPLYLEDEERSAEALREELRAWSPESR